MIDQNLRSRQMLFETGAFETNLARWKIHGYPLANSFVVGALLNPTSNPVD
jgi:hypothetical protein